MENKRFGGKKSSREDRNKKGSRKDGDGPRRMGRIQRFTIPKGTDIDYKNITFLMKCLTERGKILSRRLTSANASQQRLLSSAVKRARLLGLLPVGSTKRK